MWLDILTALALVFIIEGIAPFLNPQGLRKSLIMLAALDDKSFRIAGFVCMALGVLMLYGLRWLATGI